jgi:hypothetical protein
VSKTNTIFGRKSVAVKPKLIQETTIQLVSKKERKKRSDAKKDIKFKITVEEKKTLQLRALHHKMSFPEFLNTLVKQELRLTKNYESYPYDNDGVYVRVKLEDEYVEDIKRLTIEWQIPNLKVVHRIVKEYLENLSRPSIYHYMRRGTDEI